MKLRFAFLLAFSVVFSALSPAQEWIEVKSPHFSVVTDGGEKHGREIALRFEQMRAVFGIVFQKANVNSPVPTQIIAFRNGKEMRPYVKLYEGKPVEQTGFFVSSPDRNFIVLDLAAWNHWETVFHEYAHELANGSLPRLGPWFDEGFAEYLASMSVSGREFRIGEPPQSVGFVLAHYALMPVTALFAVQHQSETYNRSGDARQLFYAESWLAVHYIFDKQLMKQTGEYFRLVNEEHVPIEDAIRRAYGMDAKQFDAVLAAYVRSNKLGIKGQLPEKLTGDTFSAAALDPLDARVVLADLHLHSLDYRDVAVKEFEEILAAKPDSAGAHRGLGYAYLYRGDFEKAIEHFHRATRLATEDPRAYYFSALVMARKASMEGRPPGEQLHEMTNDLKKAIQLDPSFADAYSLLGYAELAEGRFDSAIASCRQAAALEPRNENYALNLARAYLAAGKSDDAKPILLSLKDSKNSGVAKSAEQDLAQLERVQAEAAAARRHEIPEATDAPQWRRSQEEIEREPTTAPVLPPDTRPVKYLRGQLLSVDCSQPPAASLSISAGAKTLKMLAPDRNKLILIGEDQFSCSWKNRKVLVNYKPGGKSDGDLVSLEVQ